MKLNRDDNDMILYVIRAECLPKCYNILLVLDLTKLRKCFDLKLK